MPPQVADTMTTTKSEINLNKQIKLGYLINQNFDLSSKGKDEEISGITSSLIVIRDISI